MTVADLTFCITTWGRRDGHQVWRVTWDERPGQIAEVTGPHDAMAAFVKAWTLVERLPWVVERA